MLTRHYVLSFAVSFVALCIVFVIIEGTIIAMNGQRVAAPDIPRSQEMGSGPALTYVVMGDSTAIGQGAPYEQSFAEQSAESLSAHYHVHLVNTGISGSRIADVVRFQLAKANAANPDIVLLAGGANDATHFTSGASIDHSLRTIVYSLRANNPRVKIVLTGSPAMGSVARFPWPARQLAGLRTRQVNAPFMRIAKSEHLVFAPIADRTGAAFLADKTLFAADKFHPNARGYELWVPVIDQALDAALTN